MRHNYTCYCPEGYDSLDDDHRRCKPRTRKEPIIPFKPSVIPVRPGSDREGVTTEESMPEGQDEPEVLSRRLDEHDGSSSDSATTAVVVCLVILVICLIIGAVIFYRRNGTHPKILVRPYVQQW